ncbi:3-hydroxyisobutyryl-CoA hydrolase [Amycolatopsis rhabdoformis]|uniref:3-hydroxyisobutyryl-CoA hydrolase n=1 Tax=Amycolatopsis rhabdoformis TaxID=1448059 RepID=A0ABZ1IFE2_9PSEU|nr:3-hydroxyisobutyryl-CoA hydrolase [Amycolatopsis rhabdoformis]WSE32766.1 3-hydroxyisobutyryl-CoA hydrolase [Amycolatopsis rhabdoformis]
MTETRTVLARRQGAIARLTVNRPEALNALDLPMIRAMTTALDEWETDPAVTAVVLDGAGDRAFCAGGDIGVVHASAVGDPAVALTLWREEYRLDARLARYPKPVVALMDGITMGGGIGIGAHAAVRVVTERSVLAMPEVAIGLAPDVGGALLLAHAPGELGTHLALTAGRVRPADAVHCGLADHHVPADRLPALVDDLAAGAPPETTTKKYAEDPGPAPLAAARCWIDHAYRDAATVEDVLYRLDAIGEPVTREAVAAITAAAPTALKVTLRAVRNARAMTSIEACLRQDFRLCGRFLAHPDLAEGIRAAILDKDRAPRWRPGTLAEVDDADVAAFFAPIPDELDLPEPGHLLHP